jgi:predicted Zn finger-like uncharacterized protein
MQIVCPNCTTTYQIAATAIGNQGRSVRCVRCQKVWKAMPEQAAAAAEEVAFAAELGNPLSEAAAADREMAPPPPDSPAAADDTPPEPSPDEPVRPSDAAAAHAEDDAPAEQAPVALADIPIPVEEAPPLQPEPGDGMALPPSRVAIDNASEDIESVAARREAAARRRRFRFRVPLPLLIFVMFVAVGGMLGLRKDVVRHVPQMASLYEAIGLPVNLRGLEFTQLKIGNEIHDGVPVLVVEGTILSKASMAVDVPRLRFALRNASGAEIYSWTAIPSQAVLEPGQSLPFRSRLASPPAEGHDVQVRFFNHRDAGGR